MSEFTRELAAPCAAGAGFRYTGSNVQPVGDSTPKRNHVGHPRAGGEPGIHRDGGLEGAPAIASPA